MKKLLSITTIACALSFTASAVEKPKEFTMDTWLAYHQAWATENGKKFNKQQKVNLFNAMNVNKDDPLTRKEMNAYWKSKK